MRSSYAAVAFAVVLPVSGLGCIVNSTSSGSSYDTEIEFQETINLGATCGSPLTSWTVTNRDTGETGTASCEQPVRFVDLSGGRVYTFDIAGRAGNRLCFQGSCAVRASSGILVQADCSRSIDRLCGF